MGFVIRSAKPLPHALMCEAEDSIAPPFVDTIVSTPEEVHITEPQRAVLRQIGSRHRTRLIFRGRATLWAMAPKFALDCTGLKDALQRLGDAIDVVSSDEFGRVDHRWQATLVAGVVQCFEFTYELSWRMLKRQLEQEVPTPSELDAMNYRDLVRLGHERGLVREPETWFEFRELRNITSHTYSEPLAQRVAVGAAPLLAQGKLLLQELERRNHV